MKRRKKFLSMVLLVAMVSSYAILMATVLQDDRKLKYKSSVMNQLKGIYLKNELEKQSHLLEETQAKNMSNMTNSAIWDTISLVSDFLTQPCCRRFRRKSLSLDLKCNECAFVSSSGHLQGSGAGAEIDSANCVFRMNDSPTVGYEKDVGTKTTVRYLAPLGAKNVFENHPQLMLSGKSRPKVLLFHRINRTRMDQAQSLFNISGVYHYVQTLMTSKIFHHFAEKIDLARNKSSFPTGGFKIIALALKKCKSLIVYGISSPSFCRDVASKKVSDVLYHYYDTPAKDNTSLTGQTECFNFNQWQNWTDLHHDLNLEKLVYSTWMVAGINMQFRYPHWDNQISYNSAI